MHGIDAFALDFDGVLCDSAAETAVTAWRAGQKIWPDWPGAEPPRICLQRFLKLRPLIETGYQTIALMALIQQEKHDDATIEAQFPALCEEFLTQNKLSHERCARLFGRTRDLWMAEDLTDWLGRHRFYPGAIDAFIAKIQTTPVFILTTKQERFVDALLQSRGIAFPRKRLFGLEKNKSKEMILAELLRQPDWQGATWHFVEDRLATLLRVAALEKLAAVRLYLATWGYNTESERALARHYKLITLWNPDTFLVV